MKKRHALTLAAAAMVLAGGSAALAPSAHAAYGGGCTEGSSGPAGTVYSCISAPGSAKVEGDGYVYLSSVPSGCTVNVQVKDTVANVYIESESWPCSTTRNYYADPVYTDAGDEYATKVWVGSSVNAGVWSPGEVEP